jgi:hypothetical protein
MQGDTTLHQLSSLRLLDPHRLEAGKSATLVSNLDFASSVIGISAISVPFLVSTTNSRHPPARSAVMSE